MVVQIQPQVLAFSIIILFWDYQKQNHEIYADN